MDVPKALVEVVRAGEPLIMRGGLAGDAQRAPSVYRARTAKVPRPVHLEEGARVQGWVCPGGSPGVCDGALRLDMGGGSIEREEPLWVLEEFTMRAAKLLVDNYLEPYGYVGQQCAGGEWAWVRLQE